MSKTILITGASNGFGLDMAKSLAESGHRIFATMRHVHDRHGGTAAELSDIGVEILELDVTSTESVDAAFTTLFGKTGGKLDVLVNNAGVAVAGLSETFTPEQVREMFEVNVFGMQRVLRAALPHMRSRRSGLVINIGSILGRVTIPFLGLYGASKHAVEAMTESYRYEVSQLGIDIVLLQPGPFPTKLYASMQAPLDTTRANQYGEIAALPTAVAAGIDGIFKSDGAPDPHDVAVAVVQLIGMPAGQRPARLIVGSAFGADAANAALSPLQRQLISVFGLDHLDTFKSADIAVNAETISAVERIEV